jgi:hypothetical protein
MRHLDTAEKPLKRVALIQSAYIPWKGFFDLIGRCDEYIIYDSAAFSKNHWHNRNRIKTPSGPRWLTIPVITAGRLGQRIDEVDVNPGWADSHWARLVQTYRGAPYFSQLEPTMKALYDSARQQLKLSAINELFIRKLTAALKLDVRIVRDTTYEATGKRTERIVSLCRGAGASHYLSGPSAAVYLEPDKFKQAGITLEWMSYGPYQPYEQLHGPFEDRVSILDVLFSLGPDRWKESLARQQDHELAPKRIS